MSNLEETRGADDLPALLFLCSMWLCRLYNQSTLNTGGG